MRQRNKSVALVSRLGVDALWTLNQCILLYQSRMCLTSRKTSDLEQQFATALLSSANVAVIQSSYWTEWRGHLR